MGLITAWKRTEGSASQFRAFEISRQTVYVKRNIEARSRIIVAVEKQ